jgi:hypothetical protein
VSLESEPTTDSILVSESDPSAPEEDPALRLTLTEFDAKR